MSSRLVSTVRVGLSFPLQVSSNFVSKLILQRHLIWNFVRRDLKTRYVGSFMGFFWAIVHPLVLLISYYFVFWLVFRVRDFSPITDNFAVFVFAAILPWLYFQDTVLRCCSSVVDNAALIRKAVFPSEILPLSVAISNLATHLVGVLVFLVVLWWLGLGSLSGFLLLLYLPVLFLMSLGVGWIAAALQVFLRDTLQILTVVLVFWFWFTPVFYSVEKVPAAFRPFIQANPMTFVVEGYREVLLGSGALSLSGWGGLTLWGVGFFLLGGAVFRSTKRDFVDVL